MALEDILKALEDKAKSQIEQIKAEGERRARDIKSEAEREASHARRLRLQRFESSVRSEANSIVYSATLKAKNRLIDAQNEVVSEAFDLAASRLAEIRNSPDYPRILEKLIDECLEFLDSRELRVRVNAEDRELASRILKEKGVDFEMLEPLDTSGGVWMSAREGEISIHNTFESRLSKAKEKMRVKVSRALFG